MKIPKKVYLTSKNIALFIVCSIAILIIIIGVTVMLTLTIFKSILMDKIKKEGKEYGNTLADEIVYIMKHQCDEGVEYLTFDSQLTENYMNTITIDSKQEKYHYDYSLAKFLMLLCENVTNTNCIDSNDIILPSSFDKNLITILYSKTKYTKNVIIYGYLFFDTNTKTTFLIWSGTATARMWISDLNFHLKSYPKSIINDSDIKVHEGYLNVYLKFRKQILKAWDTVYKNKSSYFIIAGHSLGGSLTYISAFDLMTNDKNVINIVTKDNNDKDVSTPTTIPIIVHTFGSPRVGNSEFVSQYNKLPFLRSIRIFNTEDLIPYIPLPVIQNINTSKSYFYEHCDIESKPFTINLGSNVSNHIESYIRYLPKY